MSKEDILKKITKIAEDAWSDNHAEIAQILFTVIDGVEKNMGFEMLEALSVVCEDI